MNKEEAIKTLYKSIETYTLNLQYLYSSVLEKKLEDADFNIFKDDNHKISSEIFLFIVKRVYLGLSQEEQKELILLSMKHSSDMKDSAESTFNIIDDSVLNIIDMLHNTPSEEYISDMTTFVNTLVNGLIDSVYKRIENIPDRLFKKIVLNFFRPDVNVINIIRSIFTIDVSDAELDTYNNMEESKLLAELINAYATGNIKTVKIISKILDDRRNK